VESFDLAPGAEFELHARTVNPQFVRVLRTIGFDRSWARAEGQYLYDADGTRYTIEEYVTVHDWLQGDFGVARAPRTVRVLVEFDARAAEVVRGRKVHASQRLALAADGRARASFAVPQDARVMAAVRAWILGFGASARVVEPRELADDVAGELRRAAARYP